MRASALVGLTAAVVLGLIVVTQREGQRQATVTEVETPAELQLGTLPPGQLARTGLRFERAPWEVPASAISADEAIAIALESSPGTAIDAELAVWRDPAGEGLLPDRTLVWIVQTEPESYYISCPIHDDCSGTPTEAGRRAGMFHIEVINASSGEFVIAHEAGR